MRATRELKNDWKVSQVGKGGGVVERNKEKRLRNSNIN